MRNLFAEASAEAAEEIYLFDFLNQA